MSSVEEISAGFTFSKVGLQVDGFNDHTVRWITWRHIICTTYSTKNVVVSIVRTGDGAGFAAAPGRAESGR